VPLQDGYVTMMRNPSSPFSATIQDLFDRLSLLETTQDLPDADCEAAILQELGQLGFDSYDAMAWHAIWAEFQTEIAQQSTRSKVFFSIAERVRNSLAQLKDLQAELLGTVALLRDLPTNMRIIASRLEPSGGPLSAMSDIYSTASSALFSEIVEFSTGATSLTGDMENAFGKACAMKICAILQDETTQNFRNDPPQGAAFSLSEEFDALDQLNTICLSFEAIGLYGAQKLAQKINAASYDLRRSMLGLDTVRVMGLVESGRMGAEGSRIGATMEQIGHCHDRIVVVLQKIKDTAASINIGVTELRNTVKRKSALAAG
jgi:aerotaxis receptor